SPRAKVLAGYTNSRVQFSGGTTSLISSTIDTWTGGTEYALTPITMLLSDYFYNRFSFHGDGTLETHTADVGARQQYREDLTVDGRVGGTYLPSTDRLTPTFNVGVIKKFSATEVSGRYLRSVTNSGGLAPLVSVQNVVQLLVTHHLTPTFTATLAGNYATTKTIGVSTVDLKSYSVIPGLTYALTRWATLFASYSYFKQDVAGQVGFSLNRTQATIGLTVTWQ
ncbi:MAG TPA: outer membrane beta-barrel protein, partial [Nitrospiraceae bacterium]|nr:outer membrane beta-barrel protein [Nitrospiraceae bacterium]